MEKLKIRKEIAILINSIKEHSDNIGDQEHIPQLELEMILKKITKLYEKSIVFNHLHSNPDKLAEEDLIAKKQPIIEEQLISENSIEETIVLKPEIIAEPIKKVEIAEEIIVPPVQELKAEPIDQTKSPKPSLSSNSIILSINDKFLFSNNLFKGNMQELTTAIQNFNSQDSLENVITYFDSLQQLYNWDLENEAVKQFLVLVSERFT